MKMLLRAALALLVLPCAPAMADDPNLNRQSALPAGYSPATTIYCPDANGKTVACAFGVGSGGGAVADVFSSGTIALGTANATFTVPVAAGQTTASFTISGLTGSGATVVAEGNSAGTGAAQWGALSAYPASTGVATSSWTSDSSFSFNVSGRTQVRLRVSVAGTGTASATANLSVAQRDVGIDKPLPAGTNKLGGVTIADSDDAALGAKADVPWDGAASVATVNAAMKYAGQRMELARALLAGTLTVTGSVSVSNFPGTQPVSEKQRSSFFAESTAALGASASFTGTARDAGATPSQWATFSCFFRADQAGSGSNGAVVQQSVDGTSGWTTVVFATYTANASTVVTSPIFARYSRCLFNNGATAQTSFTAWSRLGAN